VQEITHKPAQTLCHSPTPTPNQRDKGKTSSKSTQCKKTETPKRKRKIFSRGVPQPDVDVELFGIIFLIYFGYGGKNISYIW
jgi:hypothetical protein